MPSIQEFIPFKDYMYIGNVNEIDLDKLQVFVDSVYSSDKEGRQFSNRGGWQSNDLYPFQNLYSEHTTFSQLLDCLKSTLFFGLKESTENEFNIEVGNSWININTEGDFNIFHSHPGGIYSSVFYLTDDNSPIMFADLNTARSAFIGFTKTTNVFLCDYTFHPKKGDYFFFPSYIQHMVEPTINKRISIASNWHIENLEYKKRPGDKDGK